MIFGRNKILWQFLSEFQSQYLHTFIQIHTYYFVPVIFTMSETTSWFHSLGGLYYFQEPWDKVLHWEKLVIFRIIAQLDKWFLFQSNMIIFVRIRAWQNPIVQGCFLLIRPQRLLLCAKTFQNRGYQESFSRQTLEAKFSQQFSD